MRSATGAVIAPRFLVNGAAGAQARPEVVGLGDDRLAVVWIDDNTDRVRFAIHDVAGNVISAAADVSTSPTFTAALVSRQIDLAELANGNFVVAYRAILAAGSDAVFRIFRNDGVAVTAEINIDVVFNPLGPPAVATLADGRFVVMNGIGQQARIFNPDGSGSTAIFPVLSTGGLPQVTALHDGRFMAIAVASGTSDIIARVMFADGTPDGAEFTVNTVPTGTTVATVAPSIATLADGRVVVSWTTNESGNFNVKAAVFDPREAGLVNRSATSFADDWVGTGFNDRVYMGQGNDLMRGALGADTLFGEAGQDTLNGDAGNDKLFGGNDGDTLNGGSEDDTLNGELGNDALNGGFGSDTLNGGENNDTLNGDGDGDVLNGNNGNDTLNGGSGLDVLNGGNGDDTLNGGLDKDTLNGDADNDTLFGGSDGDTLRGGSGNDRQAGGTGNDVHLGGAGFDVFVFTDDTEGNDRIDDWLAADDQLEIDASTFGGGLDPFVGSTLAADRLVLGSAPTATQAFGQFLYNTTNGQLSWDVDGTGATAAVAIARLLNSGVAVATLAVTDFDIVA